MCYPVPMHVVTGSSHLSARLDALLTKAPALQVRTLINADGAPDVDGVVERCRAFADASAGGALLVAILYAAQPGLAAFKRHAANAALWAFTRQAALDWAPRKIRVNAIGLGASPAGPDEAQEQSGRAAADIPAQRTTPEDIARTIRAMAAWPSMTGQIIRLGAA